MFPFNVCVCKDFSKPSSNGEKCKKPHISAGNSSIGCESLSQAASKTDNVPFIVTSAVEITVKPEKILVLGL
jgi:hypothetical protein